VKDPFRKDDLWQMQFLENLGILVVKNNLPMLIFLSKNSFHKTYYFSEKTKQLYVFLALIKCHFSIVSFV
jgi:hypothetical protein